MRKIISLSIVLMLALSLIIAGCSSYAPESAAAPAADESYNYDTAPAAEEPAAYEDSAEQEIAGLVPEEEPAAGSTSVSVSNLSNRKIIKNGSCSIEAKDFDNVLSAINQMITKYNAVISQSSTNGSKMPGIDNRRSASFTIWVPAESLGAFMNDLDAVEYVVSKNVDSKDITGQYYDIEAHLRQLRIRQKNLEDIYAKTVKIEDMVKLEQELADVRYEIENYSTEIKRYDELVRYSTLTIDIHELFDQEEPAPITQSDPTFGQRLGDAFNGGIDVIIDIAQGLLIVLVAALPVLLPLGVIALIVLFIVFRVKRHKKSKASPPENK